jgi:nitrogen-specific signal transduction histidine kinase
MVLSLLITRGNEKGKVYEVTARGVTIGRDLANVICLTDLEASRRHCQIQVDGESVKLVDLNSSNGTLVNGRPVVSAKIDVGDQISIGRTVLVAMRSEDLKSAPVLPAGDVEPRSVAKSDPQSELVSDERFISQIKSNLQFMYDASLATSKKEISPMMDKIMLLIFDWLTADRGCVMLRDGPGEPLSVRSMKHRDPSKRDRKFTISRSIARHVDANKIGVLSADLENSEALKNSQSIKASGLSEVLCVPIEGRKFTLGLIYVDRLNADDPSGPRFNDDHLKLMHVIAHQAAIAIENEAYYSAILEKERMLAVGETAANLSHRIKNILQSIYGGTHLVESGLVESSMESVQQGWAIVKRNQDRMSNLVLEMLAINDEYVPQLMMIDMIQLIKRTVEECRESANRLGVKLNFQSDVDHYPVGVDPEGMARAVGYVIDEAIKNSRGVDKGVVGIDVVSRAENFEMHVRSAQAELGANHSELPENDLFFAGKHLFMGLELSAAQKILRGHQGDLEFHTEVSREEYCLWFPTQILDPKQTETILTSPKISSKQSQAE